ncbi:hypothetical protein ACFWTE_28115 [Nocardiopsis sp. NPDC058631]|uniref:hypothetical protein n=1 Tax=Nocardiopsis sp. NPDC058631 TaxID=3346566 RepID=UPI00365001B5
MRYPFVIFSALWPVARALVDAARRRSGRVRRYAAEPRAPRPNVVTGPIPLLLPSSRTGDLAPVVPLAARRRRADRPRLGTLIAVALQAEGHGPAVRAA